MCSQDKFQISVIMCLHNVLTFWSQQIPSVLLSDIAKEYFVRNTESIESATIWSSAESTLRAHRVTF